MRYESLHHNILQAKSKMGTVYDQRLNSLATKSSPLSIKQYGLSHANLAFYCYTEEIALLQDQIMAACHSLIDIATKLPAFAMPKYLRAVFKSTDDIEGVRSKYYKLFTITDANINRGDLPPFIIGMLEFTRETTIHTTNSLQEKYHHYKNAKEKTACRLADCRQAGKGTPLRTGIVQIFALPPEEPTVNNILSHHSNISSRSDNV